MQVASEVENNNVISFLDLEIMKLQTGQLKFRVHRKQTHTDTVNIKILSFDSYNTNNPKESVVRTLFNGADTMCDQEFRKDELIMFKRFYNKIDTQKNTSVM